MGQIKPDGRKCLNVYLPKDLSDRLEAFCANTGRTKTVVAERAIRSFLDGSGPEDWNGGRRADGDGKEQS